MASACQQLILVILSCTIQGVCQGHVKGLKTLTIQTSEGALSFSCIRLQHRTYSEHYMFQCHSTKTIFCFFLKLIKVLQPSCQSSPSFSTVRLPAHSWHQGPCMPRPSPLCVTFHQAKSIFQVHEPASAKLPKIQLRTYFHSSKTYPDRISQLGHQDS
jgi:hypothetical protein